MGTTKSGRGRENAVNKGSAPDRRRDDITGNVKERHERTQAEKPAPIDADTAHERAK